MEILPSQEQYYGTLPPLNQRVVRTLEHIIPSGSNIFHCPEHNMLYMDEKYQIPIVAVDTLQRELKLDGVNSVIFALESLGYSVHTDPCYECIQKINREMAQA